MNDDEKDKNYWQQDPNEETQPESVDTTESEESTEEQSAPQDVQESSPESSQETSEESDDDEPDENPVTWSASEYIHGEKNGLWYVLFVVVVLGLIALDIFLLKSYTFSALVIVMAVALVIYSRRPPRVMQYALSSNHGLYVGEKLYHFSDFKAFGVIKDGEHHSIMLIPTKRFAPGVSVYFPEEAGEQIVDVLGMRLPMKPLKLDAIDAIIRTLRL